jgi:hypothetical protein
MKRLANALVPALSVAIGVTHPAIVSAQSPHDSAAHGPAVGEELIVTYVTSRYGPGALRSTSTVRLELVANDSHQLVGRSRGQLLVIDARSIRRVKRRIGTRPASAPAMVAGSAAGFAAGFLIGATSSAGGSQVSGGRSAADDGLVAGVLVGAPLGAFVAWVASRSRPIYEDLGIGDVRPSVRVAPTGQVGLAISIPTG